MAGSSNTVELLVSVDDDHMDVFPEVVERLSAAGMHVTRTVPVLGTIAGEAPVERVHEFSSVPGVGAVEKSRAFDIGPPDSPIQ
jgi:hypothetical protein